MLLVWLVRVHLLECLNRRLLGDADWLCDALVDWLNDVMTCWQNADSGWPVMVPFMDWQLG